MTDPRIIPAEELARYGVEAEVGEPAFTDVEEASRRILALIQHGKTLAEQVDQLEHALLIMQQHEIRNAELQDQVDTLTREMEECHGHLDVAAVVVRAEKAEAERDAHRDRAQLWKARAKADSAGRAAAEREARQRKIMQAEQARVIDSLKQRLADRDKAWEDTLREFFPNDWMTVRAQVRALLAEDGA